MAGTKHQGKQHDFTKLRALLDAEPYPRPFIHKFIGRNSPAFHAGVVALEGKFPKLRKQSARTSQADNHLALTYVIDANNSDEIIDVLQETYGLTDVLVVL